MPPVKGNGADSEPLSNGEQVIGVQGVSKNSQHFYDYKKVIDYYQKYRPRYTQEIFDYIIDACTQRGCGFDFAVDIACGGGEATAPLAKHFKKVLGCDVSETQLAGAPRDIPNLSFRRSPAEELPFLENSSVDLITCATAFHWINAEKFLKEATRILKPKGMIIIYGYDDNIPEIPELAKYFIYLRDVVMENHWHKEYLRLRNGYKETPQPFSTPWERKDDFLLSDNFTIDEYVGHLGSLSPTNQYQLDHPEINFLGGIVRDKLCEILNARNPSANNNEVRFKVNYPLYMMMTQKPA